MPWNQGGGGGPWGGGQKPNNPWGGRPSGSGGGGGKGPDFEEIIRQGQARLREVLPGGMGAGRGLGLGALALIAMWLLTGFYRVEPANVGVVLRFGEMERDSMVAHGACRFTRGRMYDSSDKYQVHVCKRCGMIAAVNDKMGIHCCHMCENRTEFAYVEIPYACKLLFQELQTMNIAPRIMTE